VQRNYSGEVESTDILWWQRYPGHCTANLVIITQVLSKGRQKHSGLLFIGTRYWNSYNVNEFQVYHAV